MDFYNKLVEIDFEGSRYGHNPYAGFYDGEWKDGSIAIDYLNSNFGEFETVEEMKNATESEGLKLYFDWLKSEGVLT